MLTVCAIRLYRYLSLGTDHISESAVLNVTISKYVTIATDRISNNIVYCFCVLCDNNNGGWMA